MNIDQTLSFIARVVGLIWDPKDKLILVFDFLNSYFFIKCSPMQACDVKKYN